MNSECPRGLSQKDIIMEFGKDDDSVKKCEKCPNMEYSSGLMYCKKISKESEV